MLWIVQILSPWISLGVKLTFTRLVEKPRLDKRVSLLCSLEPATGSHTMGENSSVDSKCLWIGAVRFLYMTCFLFSKERTTSQKPCHFLSSRRCCFSKPRNQIMPREFSSHLHTHNISLRSSSVFSSNIHPNYIKLRFHISGVTTETLCLFLIAPMRATSPAHLFAWKLFVKYVSPTPVTSSLVGLNVLPRCSVPVQPSTCAVFYSHTVASEKRDSVTPWLDPAALFQVLNASPYPWAYQTTWLHKSYMFLFMSLRKISASRNSLVTALARLRDVRPRTRFRFSTGARFSVLALWPI
jgi:hypothetical protein